MTRNDLKPEQARRLRLTVARDLRYLSRLCQRMTRLGFPPDDRLYVAADRARAFMQDLHVAAHYAGCKHGVGRATNE